MNDKLAFPKTGDVLGHPSQLFVLFFTEMWERFSYYGMRALLVLFLTASIMDGGYGWERSNALELYALYTGLVYFTPMIGGMLADKYLGYRKAVIWGAFIMALGHGFMALEIPAFFYAGLAALILGNGLFKPNISSMVGQLYEGEEDKKDSAYTIFYMGINAGAFLGILLCGYIGEKVSWSLGFGLAMIFMIAGALQFWWSGKIFGDIGKKPEHDGLADVKVKVEKVIPENNNRVIIWSVIGVVVAILMHLLMRWFYGTDLENILSTINRLYMPGLLFGSVIGTVGFIVTDPGLSKIERDRVWVIVIYSFFVIFFWWAFEQSGGSMTVFANDYTDRTLEGSGAMIFKLCNATITLGSMGVITWVLLKLFKVTWSAVSLGNTILAASFVLIWGIVIWMLYREFVADSTEVPASWFSILNSFFIITLAPLFTKFWEKKYVTSGPVKFALALFLVGLGFAFLALGSAGIDQGAKTASVSMIWLILAYFFHTSGELCISPVGLSYVSKLAPVRLLGLMFGIWFIANFIANWAAGMTGSYIDVIVENNSMSTFFLIFTAITMGVAVLCVLFKGVLTRMMHGFE